MSVSSHLHSAILTEVPINRCPAHCLRVLNLESASSSGRDYSTCLPYTVLLDRALSFRELDFIFLDDQIGAEDTTGYFAAVLAVADVAASLFAEEVVIVDFDGHGFAEAGSFHCGGSLVFALVSG